jgi:hypothetical protein
MRSVTVANKPLASESLGDGAYRIRLDANRPAKINYTWTVALNDLKFEKGHYRIPLQTTMPVQSYAVKVAIDPNGPWMHFKKETKYAWTSFASVKQEEVKRFFGSCSVGIRAKK